MAIKVSTEVKRPSPAVLAGFRRLLEERRTITPGVSDAMNRLNAMSSDIKPLFDGIRFVGTAVTVKAIASDLSPIIKALAVAQKGDVIVVSTGNSKDTAFWGVTFASEAQRKGIIGVILDSAVRDVDGLKEVRFPVWCQGIAAKAAAILGFGYVNFPIQCGGVVVSAGDIVIADDSGVVVVPQEEAKQVLQKAKQFLETEAKITNRVRAGEHIGNIVGLDKLEKGTLDLGALGRKSPRR